MAYNDFDVNFKPTASPVNQQADIFNNLNSNLSGAIAGQAKTPQLISQYNEQFGVPQMQAGIQAGTEQFDMLGNSIRGIPQDIAQRSQESILTQGQKNRQVQSEQAPLMEQQNLLGQNLSRQQANLGVAQSNASQMVSAAQVDQEKALMPYLKAYDNESIMSSMRMTGWSFENQSELTRLLSNQSAGIQLSEGEKNRANQLAIQEREFANNLKIAQNTKQPLMSVGAGTSIFDPSTGKSVFQAPYKPESGGSGGYTPKFSGTSVGAYNQSVPSQWQVIK